MEVQGHLVWNAARVISDYIEADPRHVRGKCVLELGAGAGLPSIVAALNGAQCTVITDYPDEDLVSTLRTNVAHNVPAALQPRVFVCGYKWGCADEGGRGAAGIGHSTSELLNLLTPPHAYGDEERKGKAAPRASSGGGGGGFNVILLSDVIFNHVAHAALLRSCNELLHQNDPSARILVAFSHHRPRLAAADLRFFSLASEEQYGW